jgi:GNAT superfamily N-acetyltransferase
MTFSLRIAAHDDADLEAVARTVGEVRPHDPTSAEELRWEDRTYPGTVRFLAEVDGRVVGAATVGRIYVHPPEYPALWATIDVLPPARRAGIGTALLAAVSKRARELDKPELFASASEAQPEGIEFLAHRGFREYERDKAVELPLAGLIPPDPDPPPGIELTSLAERPGLVEGVHAVAMETFADIPSGGEPMAVGDLAEFRARDVDRAAIPPDAFMVAVELATGRVVGYASLLLAPSVARRWAWHDMTAVIREWRGRRVAASLKRATIGWAIANGLDALQSGNDVDNAPMRAINARLGYQPLPDRLTMRGPIAPVKMDQP